MVKKTMNDKKGDVSYLSRYMYANSILYIV